MRKEYYAPVGNPLNVQQLPAQPLAVSMLPPRADRRDTQDVIIPTIVCTALLSGTLLVLYQPPGWNWLEPWDVLFVYPVLAVTFGRWVFRRRVADLFGSYLLLAVFLLMIHHRTSWAMQIVTLCASLGLLIYAYCRHWTELSVTSPLHYKLARKVRRENQRDSVIVATIVAALVGGILWTGSTLLQFLFLAASFSLFVVPLPRGVKISRWTAIRQSAASWFAYQAPSTPGLVQSPVGSCDRRMTFATFVALLTAIVIKRWEASPIPKILEWGLGQHHLMTASLEAQEASAFLQLRHLGLLWGVIVALVISLPVVLAWGTVLCAVMPVVLHGAVARAYAMANDNTESILANLRSSPNATERGSIYYGRVVSDGSPMLVPREAIQEHVHIAGPSGGGKTALYLAPTLEQLVWNGDCSAIMLDLKADSLELLATLQQAAETVRSEKGTELALKVFSSQSDRPTLAFNPLTQRFWKKLDLYTKTDLLCAACGLAYGTEYAHAYYSTANSAVLYYSMQKFGEATNFAELAEAIGQVISSSPKKRDLHPEILKAGNHVHEVMKRLAACPGLNASAHTSHPTEVLDHAIDMEDVFLKPQLLYFHLPSTVSPTAAPEIARLATYMLLAAATKTKRNHPVFLVIDEFQRMVAGNLEFLLQLARSMGVGVILANQSLQDLRKPTLDLIPVIETNCRVRQWLGVLSPEDQDRLIKISGETVDYSSTWSTSVNAQGGMSYSKSVAEQVVPRLSVNDVRAVSDHPLRSFFLITRGAGYAQYSGLPVIIESKFHISKEEYERRKSIDWPRLAGSFDPCDYPDEAITQPLLPTPSRSAGPQWSEEVIGEQPERVVPLSDELRESLNSLFGQENEPLPRPPRRSRRKPS